MKKPYDSSLPITIQPRKNAEPEQKKEQHPHFFCPEQKERYFSLEKGISENKIHQQEAKIRKNRRSEDFIDTEGGDNLFLFDDSPASSPKG